MKVPYEAWKESRKLGKHRNYLARSSIFSETWLRRMAQRGYRIIISLHVRYRTHVGTAMAADSSFFFRSFTRKVCTMIRQNPYRRYFLITFFDKFQLKTRLVKWNHHERDQRKFFRLKSKYFSGFLLYRPCCFLKFRGAYLNLKHCETNSIHNLIYMIDYNYDLNLNLQLHLAQFYTKSLINYIIHKATNSSEAKIKSTSAIYNDLRHNAKSKSNQTKRQVTTRQK